MATTTHPPTRIVVVTGPPASGKTTLARTLSERLAIPLIAKVGITERLYDAFGSGDREWSRWLGRATYPLIYHFLEAQLRVGCSVVVEGTFGPEISNAEFAALHERWPFNALQLYLWAPDEILASRYEARAPERHPGHVDASIVDEVRDGQAAGRWQPLQLPGELLKIDTRSFEALDIEAIVSLVGRHLKPGRAEASASTSPLSADPPGH
jgi:predicted kinase